MSAEKEEKQIKDSLEALMLMSPNSRLKFLNENQQILNFVMNKTQFLKDSDDFKHPMSYRIKLVLAGVSESPKCPTCGKSLEFSRSKQMFKKHCNSSCASLDPEVVKAHEKTSFERHGCKRFNNHEMQERTMLEKHGVKSALCKSEFRDKGKITLFEKYGSKNFNNPQKATKTSKDRYGTGRNNQKS